MSDKVHKHCRAWLDLCIWVQLHKVPFTQGIWENVWAAEGEPAVTDAYIVVACHHVLQINTRHGNPHLSLFHAGINLHHRTWEIGPPGSDSWNRCILNLGYDLTSASPIWAELLTHFPASVLPFRQFTALHVSWRNRLIHYMEIIREATPCPAGVRHALDGVISLSIFSHKLLWLRLANRLYSDDKSKWLVK